MKTIAEQLGVTDFPFLIKDKQGNEIYYEVDGYWCKKEYDSENREIYCEDSSGFSWKREYDSNGNVIYYENSNAFWYKYEYDSLGGEKYYENSRGEIIDNRPKDDVITLNGIKYKRIEQ